MPTVKLPDGTTLNFPDGMSEADMASAISTNFPQFAAPAPAAAASSDSPGILSRISQAIKDIPILAPGEEDLGVMGRATPEQLKPKAPASMGPMYDKAYAKVLADEYADPLDPRLAAIKPADALAKMQNAASAQHAAGDRQWARVLEDGARQKDRDAADMRAKLATYSPENLAGNTVKNVRNVAAGALKIGPTALKGVFDISQLLTGGKVGKGGSDAMQEGMRAIDDVIADPTLGQQGQQFQALMADPNANLKDMYQFLQANPEILLDNGITTVGSMFLPAGAAKGVVGVAGRLGASAAVTGAAATAASIGTVAAQNAADTFTSDALNGAELGDKYRAAAFSAGMSVLAGMVFHGGAEGEIARRMAGVRDKAGSKLLGVGKAALNEGAQEIGEEVGNAGGEAIGSGNFGVDQVDNNTAKRLAFAGTLGAMFGAASHAGGAGHQAEDPAAAAAATAEAARQAALNKWGNSGLSPSSTRIPGAPAGRTEPSWNDVAGTPAARPEPSMADIANASSVDEAIAAASAVVDAPARTAHATADDIEALEQAAGMGAAPGKNPGTAPAENLPVAAQAAQILESAGKEAGAPSVWRRANDPTIPTLNDVLAGPDGIPTLTEQPDIPTLTDSIEGIPTLTDVFSSRDQEGQEWHHFPANTGTLGIPRAQMPQIKAEHRGAMVNFLNARGISHDQVELPAHELRPTQQEFSMSKVDQAHNHQGGDRSILVSSDGHVLDGHHQWLAKAENDEPVKAIRLNAPIRQLLDTVKEFPSATTSNGATSPSWQGSEFAPRIEKVLGDLKAAGLDDHARILESGFNDDIRHGQLDEKKTAFREENARQALANAARNSGTAPAAKIEPMTADRMHEVADVAPALPRPILEAAAKKWSPIAEKLAAMGFKYGEVHPGSPDAARELSHQLRDIVHALLGLAPRRYQAAKGHKNADPKKLAAAEKFASQVLGINTRRHAGVDTSNPISLSGGIGDREQRSLQAKRQAEKLRERIRAEDPFLALLANHGISPKDRADIGLEAGNKGNRMVPGYGPIIRKNGKRLDELALLAQEDGFLTQRDIDSDEDTGGTRKLAAMIQRAIANKEVIKAPGMLDSAGADSDERLAAEARSLGIDTEGKTVDQLYDEVTAAHQAEEAHREVTGAETVEDQALIEEYADLITPTELADAQLDDIDLDAAGVPMNNMTEEQLDAIFGSQKAAGPQADRGETEGSTAAPASEGAEGAADARGEAGGDLLTSYSAADVVARQDAEEAAAKARQAERDRLEAQRKKEQDAKEARARADATVYDFQLGQDAMDQLTGQTGLFDAPAAAATESGKTATESDESAPEDGKNASKPGKTASESTADRLLREDKFAFAQPRVHKYDPDNARPLLLIACSGAKEAGRHKAIDLYKGVMFDVLRKWMPEKGVRPDIYIVSAEHGLVHADTMLDSYERPMTAERVAELMKKGINVNDFTGKDFSQVYVAGGSMYRELADTYVTRLKKAGFVAPDAPIAATTGGIGEQRGQLGTYLRSFGQVEDTALQKEVRRIKLKEKVDAIADPADQEAARARLGAMLEQSKAEARKHWKPGMVTSLPTWSTVNGRNAVYTQMMPGVIEAIHGDTADVRIYASTATGWTGGISAIDGQLATDVPLHELGRYGVSTQLQRMADNGELQGGQVQRVKKGDILIAREAHGAATDQIKLLSDPDYNEKADYAPGEKRATVSVQYVGDREKISGRWVRQTHTTEMENNTVLRKYMLQPDNARLGDKENSPAYKKNLKDTRDRMAGVFPTKVAEQSFEPKTTTQLVVETATNQEPAPPLQDQLEDLGGMFDRILAEELAAKPEQDLGDMFDAVLAEEINAMQQPARTEKAKRQRKPKTEKAAGQESVVRAGEIGGKMSAGEVVRTSSGRETSPFPKVDMTTERKAGNTWKAVDRWLMQNALDEAEARGDNFNARQFRAQLDKPSQADKDSAEQYLFGDQPAVIPSILKPLGGERGAGEAALSAAKNATASFAEAVMGLGEIFGANPPKMGIVPFEETKYQRAAPHFDAAVAAAGATLKDIQDVMRAVVRAVLQQFGAETAANMRPYVIRYIEDYKAGKTGANQGESNADVGTGASAERDSGIRTDAEPATEQDIFDVRRAAGDEARPADAGPDAAGDGSVDRAGVSGRDAADGGTEGDQRVSVGQQPRGPAASTAKPRNAGRGRDRGNEESESQSEAVGEPATRLGARLSLDEKRQQQLDAESIPVIAGDRANIDATLPYLLQGQRDDVHFAETRFANPDKMPGVMYTNGTGTGKTFTGLGIAKRFERMGKGNGIIVVPNNQIAQDWIDSGKALGLNIRMLDSMSEHGDQGMVITTYANFGNNKTLADRDWDFVMPDEAHYLMSSKDGKMTDALQTLRALTRHTDGWAAYSRMVNRDLYAQLAALGPQSSRSDGNQKSRAEYDKLLQQIIEREKEQHPEYTAVANSPIVRPKTVFLSATPFAYVKAVDYAEGYLFSYGDGGRIGNSNQDGRAHFFVQHFGYRIRYHKLTEPDANVDQGLMARQFNSWLKSEGALSGRLLDVEADYSRRFIMVKSALGTKIDEGLEFVREHEEYKHLYQPMMKQFDYLSRRYLLEAIKAKEALPIIQQHLDLGRKVVVVHDYKKGGAFNPFHMQGVNGSTGFWDGNTYREIDLASLASKFRAERPDLVKLKIPEQSALQILTAAFPGALVHNGDVPARQLEANKRQFNDDNGDKHVIILQSDKGREGISLHDTTGRYQRAMVNVGMQGKPTSLIQLEGRTYRTGQVTDAVLDYLNTGTAWERYTFAQTIAERADTAEALAMGDLARGLKDSIIEAFENSAEHAVTAEDGKGGKERDRQMAKQLTEWDRAKAFYYSQLKRNSASKAQEGLDYYATPEPVGLKMVEWADIRPGEDVLEPSAGHGAIARWFPVQSNKTIVEPSTELIGRARMAVDGAAKFVQSNFEDLHLVNKYDAIVMNPPFGKGGSLAIPHLAKAYTHLREGGRIVALLPRGGMATGRLEKWLHGENAPKDLHLVAEIDLPAETFRRAGAGVLTRIVVLDKLEDAEQAPNRVSRDYVGAESPDDLFERIQHVAIPGRAKVETGEDIAIEEAKPARAPRAAAKPARQAAAGATGAERFYAQFEFDHTKTGAKMYGAAMLNRVSKDAYKEANAIAKTHSGWYNTFVGGGALRGFLFKTDEARKAFMAEAGQLEEVRAGLDEQNSLSGDLGVDSQLLDRMEAIADDRGMFKADQLLPWVQEQSAPGAPALANWLEVMGDATVSPSSVVKFLENSGNTMFSKFSPGRRQALAAAAAAAIAGPAAAGDVKLGQTKPLPAAVLGQRVAPSIEKILRDGQAGGTTSLNGMEALRKALKAMSLTGPKEVRNLALQVANLLPTSGTLMLTVDDTRRMNVHGVVSLAPMLHMQLFTAEGRTGLTYETVIHEAMHVAIAARYRSLSGGLARENDKLLGLSAPAAAKALAQFESLWNEFRDATYGEKFANRDIELAVSEARGNPDEFFVRSLTDPLLQAYLASKRYEGKTMWQRFKDWIKTSLFGMVETGGTAPSWLDAALYASGDVMDAMGGDRADFARMRAIGRYQDARQSMRSAAVNDSAAASSPLAKAARKRFDQVMIEAEHWLKANGKTASLTDLEPRWAMDSLDMVMSFGTGKFSEQAKEQGRAIWERAREALKNLARHGGDLEGLQDQMYSRRQLPAATWSSPEMTMQDTIVHTLQDKHVDMRKVVETIRDQAGQLEDKWDPYLQEELFHGRAATGFKDFLQGELRPLLEDMKARGVTMEGLEEYLHMRHAEEANKQIASVNPDMPDGGSGVDTADARAYLGALPAQQLAHYQALATRVDSIIKGTQQQLVAYGLEKQSTIDTWNNTYKNYVPLFREDMDDPLGGMGTGQGFSVRGPASKRRTGSSRAVVDILANVAMARERAIVRGEKNRLDVALYGLALQAPNPEFWKPVNPQKNPGLLMGELIKMGLTPAEAQNIIDEPKQPTIDPNTGMVVHRTNPLLRSAPNVVAVRINGEDRYVFFNKHDPRALRMAITLKNLGNDGLNRALGAVATVTRAFASINTQYNPVFGIVNLTRDLGEGAVNLSGTPLAGRQAEFATETVRLFTQVARRGFRLEGLTGADAALWHEFEREGGITGYRQMFSDSGDRARELMKELNPDAWMESKWGKVVTADGRLKVPFSLARKVSAPVFDWLSDYNEALENITRMSAFKLARDQGMTAQQAASLAKNLTVNFNRKGAVGSQVGALYAFFNASMQGTARMLKTLQGPAGKKIIAGGLLLGVLQAVMMFGAGYDDDQPPEFIKAKNIVIPTGWVTGRKDYLTVPMPLGFSAIPTMGRLATEFALGGLKKPGKHLGKMFDAVLDTFNPIGNGSLAQVLSPTAADPIVDLWGNRDWTGKPIAREDMSGLHPTPGYTRTKDTASAFAKTSAYYLNLWSGGTKYAPGHFSPTPDQIDYLLGQFTGGVGRELNKTQQTVSSMVTGEALPAYKVPLAGRFYGNNEDGSNVSSKFYENLKELNVMHDEVQGRAKDHADPRGFLAEHPEARLAQRGDSVQREIAQLRKRKAEAVEKGERARVKEIELRMRKLMDSFNQDVDKARGKAPA